MVGIKNFKYKIDCYCRPKFKLAKTYRHKPKGEVNFNLKGKYFRKYYECLICKHHISNHKYDLKKLYSGNYISSTYGNYEGLTTRYNKISTLNPKKSDNYNRCLRINSFFKNIKKKNFKILDVGSGLGVFPKKLQSKKFSNFTLIETDNLNIQFLKKYLKFKRVYKKQSNLKKNKFDLITLNKVLEHIENPSIFLKKYLKNLKNNGYLYIEVPDLDARNDKSGYEREEFFIEHHHVFSKDSLMFMLSKLNLKIIKLEKIIEPSTKYTLFCFAQKI